MVKMNAKQLRNSQKDSLVKLEKKELYIILDNVLDTYNIGSVFRLADAGGVKKIYLCGGAETPPNIRIKRASINTTEWVEWEYCASAVEAIQKLREEVPGVQVIAIELSSTSIPYDTVEYMSPLALIVGHETEGVATETLEQVDQVVDLPMYGINISLNVMVSLGIVLYRVLSELNIDTQNDK